MSFRPGQARGEGSKGLCGRTGSCGPATFLVHWSQGQFRLCRPTGAHLGAARPSSVLTTVRMFGTRSPVVRSPNHAPQEPGSNGSAAPPFNTPDESPRHSLGSVTSLTSPRVLSPPARPLPSTLDEDPPSREDVDGFQEVLSSAHHPPIAPPRLSKGVASWMLAEIRPTSDPPRVTVYSRESSDSDERLLSFGARSNGQDFRPEPLQSVQHVASPTMDEPRALRERLAAEAARAAALEDKVQALEKHKVPRPHPPCASTSALNQRQAGSGRGVSGQTVGSPSGQILARARRSNISSRSRGSCGARKSARRRAGGASPRWAAEPARGGAREGWGAGGQAER